MGGGVIMGAFFSALWGAFLESKSAKIGTGLIAGGSSLAVLLSSTGAQLDGLKKEIDNRDKAIREYVDFKHDVVLREMRFLNQTQVEMKDLLKTMNERQYNQMRGK